MTLEELKKQARLDFLKARRLLRYCELPAFAIAFEMADDTLKGYYLEAISTGNFARFRKLLREQYTKDVGEMTIRELRDLARRFGMTSYSAATKAKLIGFLGDKIHGTQEPEFTVGEGDPLETLGMSI